MTVPIAPAGLLGADLPDWSHALVGSATRDGEDIAAALDIARRVGAQLPQPGDGHTALRWAVLAGLARVNLTTARVVEAHTDALAILAEAGRPAEPTTTFGVFAAEAPGAQLTATGVDGTLQLTGTKPWCSLGAALDEALVTAHRDGERQLFRVDLRQPGVRADPPERWVARGLRTVTSGPVHFDRTPAEPVGAPGWYLRRAGFAWGGIGVAACWYGGAVGVADTLTRVARGRDRSLDRLAVGAVDVALVAAEAALRVAADAVDGSSVDQRSPDPARLAARTRAVVADTVERVLQIAGRALGPAPLAFDEDHAARVADLTLYVRQHHGERDLAELGADLLDGGGR